ncbi:MAG TPA: hypothetical protein VHZ26_02680 [Caulobacteraceae bacterium]|jgi:hypothetical protein|nr:hypothetical protein [Caulobacteraceae bacterium]
MVAVAAGALAFAGAAHAACAGAGVIVRIEGRAQDVVINRNEAGAATTVTRPRVLEVLCHGDTVHAQGATYVVLSVDGAGSVKVTSNAAYVVPARSSAPNVVSNAYSALNDQVMPDMKRLPWNVRLKGAGDDFGFALPSLVTGGQQLRAGDRPMLVRLVGGTAPYKVELRDAHGAVVATQTSSDHDVVFPDVKLAAGDYKISASDSTPRSMDATVTVVDTAPPAEASFDGLTDPEIRTAAEAASLARDAPTPWSFEAEQQLQAAPADGLDRDKVYELIESYGTD